jgi:hypothetical protein
MGLYCNKLYPMHSFHNFLFDIKPCDCCVREYKTFVVFSLQIKYYGEVSVVLG